MSADKPAEQAEHLAEQAARAAADVAALMALAQGRECVHYWQAFAGEILGRLVVSATAALERDPDALGREIEGVLVGASRRALEIWRHACAQEAARRRVRH